MKKEKVIIKKGDKFNEWTVIDETIINRSVLCSCSCGKTTKMVRTYYLINNMSKCCGHCNKLEVNIGDKFNEWTVVDNTEYNEIIEYSVILSQLKTLY